MREDTPKPEIPFHIFALIAVPLVALIAGCPRSSNTGASLSSIPPAKLATEKPNEYRRLVSEFNAAVVALKVCSKNEPLKLCPIPVKTYDREPAAWANLALMHIRAFNLTEARKALDQAIQLAPDDPEVERLYGTLEMRCNQPAAAVKHYQHAVQLRPDNLYYRYSLAKTLLTQVQFGQAIPPGVAEEQLRAILKAIPDNFVALLELAKLEAANKNIPELNKLIVEIKKHEHGWQTEQIQTFKSVEAAVASGQPADGLLEQLKNVTKQLADYQQALRQVQYWDVGQGVDAPVERFLKVANPSDKPATPDMEMTFSAESVPGSSGNAVGVYEVTLSPAQFDPGIASGFKVPIREQGSASTAIASTSAFTIAGLPPVPYSFGGTSSTDSALFVDWSYQFKPDLVLAGAGGLRILRQKPNGAMEDVTAKTGLPAELIKRPYLGAWAFDTDQDADLDLILGCASGEPVVLQNNADGTFKQIHLFKGIDGLTGFAFADLDVDGACELAVIDGKDALHVFHNDLAGHFTEIPVPTSPAKTLAIAATDVNHDGRIDLIVLTSDGRVRRLSRKEFAAGWDEGELAQWNAAPSDGSARVLLEDLDNNGARDIVCTGSGGTQIWLGDSDGRFALLNNPVDVRRATLSEPTKDGRIDLLGMDAAGKPIRLVNRGTKAYHWQIFRNRASYVVLEASSNKRVNTFGIGGEIEPRSGLLYQKVLITGPQTHFGLGENTHVDGAQVTWPDGFIQGEFDDPDAKISLAADHVVNSPKRLKGSCPWLFANDGTGIKFVTDVLWGSPLGLRINAQNTAGVANTTDWVRVRGDQLKPINGQYDLRITAELWETHYFDLVRLMAIDHPANTEMFVDERFAIPPQKPVYRLLTSPVPVARAVDDKGRDVTQVVQKLDGSYLDTFGRGEYQGITPDHFVEFPVPSGSRWLVAQGWIHPTDSSINVAISQGKHDPPRALSLETPDGHGGWKVVKPSLGFPNGKNKTLLIDLTGVNGRARLRTNLEIFWDFLGTARDAKGETEIKDLSPTSAEVRYRGYSETTQANISSPELPDYNRVYTGPQWIDLAGYYTRYGDVMELLNRVDDRYVILNAGDEIALRFAGLADPKPGWKRDFIFVSDGWEKDGNYNTGFPRTVLPLPSHDNPAYNKPPGRLVDDPVYKRHPRDWQVYHTRYVDSRPALTAMRPR